MPKWYQSTFFPWALFYSISGAKYSWLPQKVAVTALVFIPSFESPKSVNKAFPSKSKTIFSGFKSL